MRILIVLLSLSVFPLSAQVDSLNNRKAALQNINQLRNGYLIVKLKFNERSINAYQQAGQVKTAQKMATAQKVFNLSLMQAFKNSFDFCKVYFIKASDCTLYDVGKKPVFLNDSLQYDPAIQVPDSFFLFAEFGTVMENERTNPYSYKSVKYTQESSTAVSHTAIFLTDIHHKQLREPFPFKVIVRFNMIEKAIERLNKLLGNFDYKFGDE